MSTTKKTLSDDAKTARMEAWAAKLGLPKNTIEKLEEKYGPYAYTLMQKAMTHPTDLMKAIGEGYKNSKNAVMHFLNNDISSDKIAKIVGEKSGLVVDNKIATAKIEAARKEAAEIEAAKRDVATSKKKEETKKAEEKQGRVTAKVDKKKEEKKTPEKTQEKPKEEPKKTVAQEKQQPKKEEPDVPTIAEQFGAAKVSGSTITVDKVTLSTDPAKNYKDLEAQAYQNFAKYEAKYPNFYLDCNLNPTIGVGHLVLPYSNLDSKLYHDKFLELPLTKKVGGKDVPMTKEEKEEQYKFLKSELKKVKQLRAKGYSKDQALAQTALGAKRIPGAGWDLTSSQMTKGHLNENGMKETFNKDFKQIYSETKRNVKNLDTYPLPVQLATLHTVFNRGNSGRFAGTKTMAQVVNAVNAGNEIKKDTVDAARTLAGLPMKYNKQNKLAYNRVAQGGNTRA